MKEKRPYWPALTIEAFQPHNLPRVLGAMGFDRYCGNVPRGEITWWRPAYVAIRPDTFKAYGERAAGYLASRREPVAALHRAMRDSPVHLLALGGTIVCVDEWCGEGAWRTAAGGNRGDNLIDLGMWRWSCKFGQAAHRIAKLIAFQIPTIEAEARPRMAA